MNMPRVMEALEISKRSRCCFIATADKAGVPHLATAGRVMLTPNELLEVSFWLCPRTISNLQVNKNVALIMWEPEENWGFQLLGHVEDMHESGILDGYMPGSDEARYIPQVCWQLHVSVKSIMEFKHALHNDTEV